MPGGGGGGGGWGGVGGESNKHCLLVFFILFDAETCIPFTSSKCRVKVANFG